MNYIDNGNHYIIYHNAPDIFHWGGENPTKEKPILDCWWDTENHAILLSDDDILFYSKNKEYAESYLYSRKYNL